MTVRPEILEQLIADELSFVSDHRIIEHIQSLLIKPKMRLRGWDYGEPNTYYECWDVLEESEGLGIAYSQFGFGPSDPWGLVRVSGSHRELGIGMDCAWYSSFMDAYFESAASELPIWRVFKRNKEESYPGSPIGPESDWDSAWEEVKKLRQLNDGSVYVSHHGIQFAKKDT